MLFQGKEHKTETWKAFAIRLLFYFVLMNIRGFVLFLGANWVEEQFVGGPGDVCWFSEHRRRGSSCQGVQFDFSDHTVLYLGQILPIALTEILYSQLVPISRKSTVASAITTWGLLMTMGYLYVITLVGEFQTAAYFHSGAEILVGFVLSLTIQIPLAYMLTSPKWQEARQLVFRIPVASNED